MKRLLEYVNVFQGSGEINLPNPEGLAKKWLFIKAQCGNTTPAAAYPFGKATVCAYTGGYPTGYGDRQPNSCGKPRKIEAKVHGFSHMHVSGTGAIRDYYNYAVVAPILGEKLQPLAENFVTEEAHPGYYSATLTGGTRFEGTVSKKIALHRYSMSSDGLLAIDFSNDGLVRGEGEFAKRFFAYPENLEVKIISENTVTAHGKFHGIDLYFAAYCKDSRGALLWENYEKKPDKVLHHYSKELRCGAAFRVPKNAEMRLAISFESEESALLMIEEEKRSFDEVLRDTENAWEEHLGRVKIESRDERFLEIFYSNLYHTLIKPCTGAGESFRYDISRGDGKFCFDLSTLWDTYKTALPFIFTFHPEISEEIVITLLNIIEREGHSPITLTVAKNSDDSVQARMLAEIAFADYYFRYGKHRDRILFAAETDLKSNSDFLDSGYCERYTHILDITEALGAMAEIAREGGREKTAKRFSAISERWVNAYDKETGLLSTRSMYYEGDNYNYSFRLLRNMDKRIAIRGKEKFLSDLDELFGYTRDDVERPVTPEEDPLLLGIHSFEGFNNESDMEAPYAYIYAGRHDKTCEIVSAGHTYMFTTGEGGIPGNNDSGALSSCYVWNCLGIFPVAGQNVMLIGSPKIDSASLTLANGKILDVTVHRSSDDDIYVERATLCGREISDYKISVGEFMNGGKLEIFMKNEKGIRI